MSAPTTLQFPKISPLEHLTTPFSQQVWMKRDDLYQLSAGDALCGNKWRKLKYNLIQAKNQGYTTLLTFGGAFSNHIAAVASAGHLFGLQTIGIIRGEPTTSLNHTLQTASKKGMQLHYVNRTEYRLKEKGNTTRRLLQQLGEKLFIIPEGGTNRHALTGCQELPEEIRQQLKTEADYYCLSCGTGGTMAGLIQGLQPNEAAIGFSALKGSFLTKEITKWVSEDKKASWHLQNAYHFGGYAKHQPDLLAFINWFYQTYHILLDPIYTGKMMYGVFDLLKNGFFPSHAKIVCIHTGGLQGNIGFVERFGHLIPSP